jgi:hypothetical protein
MFKLLLSFYFVFISFFSYFAQTHDLSLKLKKNEVYFHQVVVSMDIFDKTKGKTTKGNTTIETSLNYKVSKVTKTGYIIDARYNSMKMSVSTRGETVTYDSEIPNNEPVSIIFSGLAKSTFQIYLSKYGKIEKVIGIDNVIRTAIDELKLISKNDKEAIFKEISTSLGEESFRGNFELLFAIYNEKPIQMNESWSYTANVYTKDTKTDFDTKFKLLEVKDEYYLISAEGVVSPSKDKSNEASSLISGTSTSEFRLNKNNGWIQNGNVKQTLKIHPTKNQEIEDKNYSFITTQTSYTGGLILK